MSTQGTMDDLFATDSPAPAQGERGQLRRREAITDAGLAHFQAAYPDEIIRKQDLFYYIYGLLHSEDYKTRYADNLSKELPRIPRVKTAADFWAFSQAGRDLAGLHVNYEQVAMYPVSIEINSRPIPPLTPPLKGGEPVAATHPPHEGVKPVVLPPLQGEGWGGDGLNALSQDDCRVTQMKFAKGKDGAKYDKTSVIYNPKITLTGIPLEAYDYIVNGKPALEWVMERQAVTTHKDSGITNDANDWAVETMHNPRYPLELFMRVITVSLETMKIVRALPRM